MPELIRLSERALVVPARPGRTAAVALAVLDHPVHGPALALSERPRISGYDGGRMTNPGQVVLFGGGTDPGESPAETAVRELIEEAGLEGTPTAQGLRAVEEIGTWTTELGIVVTGVLVAVPPSFAEDARGDAREVARIDYASLPDVYDGDWRTAPQLVAAADRWPATEDDVLIETPTLEVRVRDHDEPWLLWGVAGHLVNEMRLRYPSTDPLLERCGLSPTCPPAP